MNKPCKKGHTDGRYESGKCKGCSREQLQRRQKANPEKWREYSKRYRTTHPDKEKARKRRVRGLPEPLRVMRSVCECCSQPPTERELALDHNHQTGEFRGWLCHRCNLGIGLLGDSLEGLLRAVRYLNPSSPSERSESL